jgi:hypothetical protein
MDWQTIAVVLVLAWAVVYLVRSAWRSRTGCGGCGCAKPAQRPSDAPTVWVAAEKLTLRRREGKP